MNAQNDAETELWRLHAKLGSWSSVGNFIANKMGGSAKSWMAIANAVANGRRQPTHSLLVAIGLKHPRRRFSVDVPDWMDEAQEVAFRNMMRTAAQEAAVRITETKGV